MPVLSTHVGSLPRSQKVVDFIFARERKEDYDQAAFDAAMAEHVLEGVRRQANQALTSSPMAKPRKSVTPPT
jgi:5-methyltetrahydropteroyltriglutamate--homocysteine methyltransferase